MMPQDLGSTSTVVTLKLWKRTESSLDTGTKVVAKIQIGSRPYARKIMSINTESEKPVI